MKYELKEVELIRELKEKKYSTVEPSDIPSKPVEPSDIPSKPLEPSDVPSKPHSENIKNLSWKELGKKGEELIGKNNEKAYSYLKESIEKGANQYWVFVKLAQVCKTAIESSNYIEESWNAEPNEYYFLNLSYYEEIINEYKIKLQEVKEKFNLINPNMIKNPHIFLLYLKNKAEEISKEEREEIINNFLSKTKFSDKEKGLELEISSFLKCFEIEFNEFEDPNIDNDKKEEMLALLKSYIEE